jgi:UDP-galactopyranose mutase
VKFDVLVVGAGFAGSVIAERCASAGAFDELDGNGVLVHRYGPHIFHTNAPVVSDYLSRFTEWIPYEHRVLASLNGVLYPIPINQTTINRLYGLSLDEAGVAEFLERAREPKNPIRTSEDVVLSSVGRDLCDKFFRGYTRKQWGLDLSDLSATVAARIPVRTNIDDRYFTDSRGFWITLAVALNWGSVFKSCANALSGSCSSIPARSMSISIFGSERSLIGHFVLNTSTYRR